MRTYIRQALRTAADVFDFRGRAGRGEFLGYLVLSQAPVLLTGIATAWLDHRALAETVHLAVIVLVTLPLFALSVRRFHDLGLAGWWSLPLLLLAGRTLGLQAVGAALGSTIRQPIEAVLGYVDWLLTIPAVVSFAVMAALPGRAREGETTGAASAAPVAR